jgi:hypothetical protein
MSVLDRVRGNSPVEPAPVEPAAVDPVLEGPGSPWGSDVVNALVKLRATEAKRDEVLVRLDERRLAIDADEASAGEEVYADPDASGRLADQLVRRRTEVELDEQVLKVAGARITEAARALILAQAAELRGRLRAGRREWRDRQETTARLLAQLAAHEGVQYVPALIDAGRLRIQPPTKTELMAAERRRVAMLVWLLDLVANGESLPSFVGAKQVTEYPASLRGPVSVVPGHPLCTYDGDVDGELAAILQG